MSVDAILIFVLYFLYTFIRTKSGKVPIIFIFNKQTTKQIFKGFEGDWNSYKCLYYREYTVYVAVQSRFIFIVELVVSLHSLLFYS